MIEKRKSYLILMADSNIEYHNAVKKAFRDCGVNHVFNSVYNGRQLLDHFLLKGAYSRQDDVQPDLVIMDIQLDLIDGFEILRFLYEKKEEFGMPVIVMTRSAHENDAARAAELGVKGFFGKPDDPSEFARIVQDICKEYLTKKNDNKGG